MSCTKCRINRANPGHRWCQQCFLGGTAQQPVCTKCRRNPANPGHHWCQQCFLGGTAQQPVCTKCRRNPANPANPGHRWCQSCYVPSQNNTQGNGDIYFYDKSAPYYEFTNFYVAPITMFGLIYPSVEHFYQASKFDINSQLHYQIRQSSTPSAARDLANLPQNKQRIRPSFWTDQDNIMYQALCSKFAQHVQLRNLLLSTGNRILIEDSPTDYYWGIGQNKTGQNKLGQLLMQVRGNARTWQACGLHAFIPYT